MKNIKKIVAFVLALTMVCSMLIVAHAVEERDHQVACPNCNAGRCTVSYEDELIATYQVVCSHGLKGNDICHRYERVTTTFCSNCYFSDVSTSYYTETVCNGR